MKRSIAVLLTILLAALLCGCSAIGVTPGADFEIIESGDGVVIKSYKGDEKKIYIPSSIDGRTVTSIGYMAFYGNKDIESIELPDSLLTIGDYAFANCEALEKLKLSGDELYEIGNSAFMNCKALTEIKLSAAAKILPVNTFSGCTSLEKVVLGTSFDTISKNAFYNCSSLKSIELPSDITEIGEYSFSLCSALRDVKIGSGVTDIADTAFKGCKDITFITPADSYAAEYAKNCGFKRSKY